MKMGKRKEQKPLHPGQYIKTQVLPASLSVKEASELLGVGRPALSNLLNGNAALSREMALRLEKTFAISQEKLLQLQAEFDQFEMAARRQGVAVRAYIPSFLKITARDIESWADGNIEARSLLAVFLRKLVHSTGEEILHVDFPGYDNAERRGWDGEIDAGATTPWIPLGKSRWEFGCNKEPKEKAEKDYGTRVRTVPLQEQAEINFIFVTPRKWAGKDEWVKQKQARGQWKSVRAYDSSDLEQWLEHSIPAQGWIAEQIGRPSEGVHSLEEHWEKWASVTDPQLPKALFQPWVERHKTKVKSWLETEQDSPLIIGGDSKDETLAFLSCLFESEEFAGAGYRDRAIVFSSPRTLRKLIATSSDFIAIVFDEEVERELGGDYRTTRTIIVRPRNRVETEPDIVLDRLNTKAFKEALATAGIEGDRIDSLARESGYSPTILRRRLAKLPAIRTPRWAQDVEATSSLIPMMLVGAWHTQSSADREILSLLAGSPYGEVEKQIAALLKFDDPPVWSVGRYRGISSKIDAFFAIQGAVTQTELDDFFFAAEIVLSETDPALNLPEDKRWAADIYGKTRDHSGALREGICETLVILAVHGKELFSERLGINIEQKVDALIRRLLTPLTEEKLLSQTGSLPLYSEAAPDEFLRILEEDLQRPQPQVYALMKPVESGMFGSFPPRTGLLWALETLAWKPEQLMRVSAILATLTEREIGDNWANKPDSSLLSLFRSWMPQTAASLNQRRKALETLTKRFPALGWKICVAQFAPVPQIGHYNSRPRWRNDASGAGQLVSGQERSEFSRAALDLALAWPDHNEETLGDLIGSLDGMPAEYQSKIWGLVDTWAKKQHPDSRRGILRERIRRFAFTRRGKHRGIKSETRDRAREAYAHLVPQDVVVRNQWLFATNWVDFSSDELEDENPDWRKREERIRALRIEGLEEIWNARGFGGIQALLAESEAAQTIGWHLAEGVVELSNTAKFITKCLQVDDTAIGTKNDELIRGLMQKLGAEVRAEITRPLLTVLPSAQIVRLLRCLPFQRDTWLHLDSLEPQIGTRYWGEVHPSWMEQDKSDVNESIDRLLEANRPRAAFQAVHFALEEVETSRLKRLLQEIATCDSEAEGTYPLDAYYVSSALDVLEVRPGVTKDEMARLEFVFIRALDHSKHGIPNLERQLGKTPSLFVQALALTYKRRDNAADPPEWRINDSKRREAVSSAAYALLDRMKRIPGTDDSGKVDAGKLKVWVTEVRRLCLKHARTVIGDQTIGQILAAAPVGDDGVWPCEPVREVLEEIGSPDIAKGMNLGVYNSRGVHWRREGGSQERELAEKYRDWSRHLTFEYPYVANLVEQIATGYDDHAVREDSEAAVRKRLEP